MHVVDESILLVIDASIRGLGAAILGIVIINALRGGRLRNPLEPTGFRGAGPGLPMLLIVVVAYFTLAIVGLTLAQIAGMDPELPRVSGSHPWHLVQCIDGVAKLAASVLIVLILSRCRAFPPSKDGFRRLPRVVGVAVVGLLILLPLCWVQLSAGQILWRLVDPHAIQPQHSVLEAIQESAWGTWGAVHLFTAALIVAPLTEELFFRGLLLQTAWGMTGRAWPAIAISAVVFGLIHSTQPQTVLPLATMGVVLGYIRVRYRSLGACVLVHALFNARTMIFVMLNPDVANNAW